MTCLTTCLTTMFVNRAPGVNQLLRNLFHIWAIAYYTIFWEIQLQL